MGENTVRQYSLNSTASGLIENSNRGLNGCGFNDYEGVAMLEIIKGLLPSQPWGLHNQPPIGLFTFLSILPHSLPTEGKVVGISQSDREFFPTSI